MNSSIVALGIAGSIALIGGVFAPVVSLPSSMGGGTTDYSRNGEGNGIYLLILGICSLLLVLLRVYRGLWFTALGALGTLGHNLFVHFGNRADIKAQLGGGEFAEAFIASIQFQWGLLILFSGIVMLIACAFLASIGKNSDGRGSHG